MPTLQPPNLKLTPEQNVRAHGPGCMGCIATNSDVMLSFGGTFSDQIELLGSNNKVVGKADKMRIVDIFITQKQALNLYRELGVLFDPEIRARMATFRPKDFDQLPPEKQWEIDKKLGILDWDPKQS